MPYTVGDTVVHPQHGAADIVETEEREFDGELRQYLVLALHDDSMTIKVPAGVVEEVGIRDVIGDDKIDEVFEVLAQDPEMVKANWQRRRATNDKRLRSGEPSKVAAVIRDLTARNEVKRLSPTEKQQREAAEDLLAGELAAATEKDVDDAMDVIVDALTIEISEAA